VTPSELQHLAALEPAAPFHIHAAEQVKEVEDCLAWSGARPVQWLLDHAAVDRRWCLVHATHMTAEETARLAASGAAAGLCPVTEANLGDGIFPGAAFIEAGGRFGVGSDSNVEITAPGELRQLEYSQRLAHRARNVLAAKEGESTGRALYERALAGGAQAVGRPVGALAPGRRADMVVCDRDGMAHALAMVDRALDAYVFVAGRAAIGSVYVGGVEVVAEGRHRRRERIAARYRRTLKRVLAA
jgi:formimidoylglutamate deiminase